MTEPSRETFAELHDAVGTTAVLDTAVQLGVLAKLAERASTSAEVARACDIPERQARLLMVALVSMGVVEQVPPDRFRPAVSGMPAVHLLLDAWRRLPHRMNHNTLPDRPWDFAALDAGALTRARELLARPGDRLLIVTATEMPPAHPDSCDLIVLDNVCHLQTEPENLRLIARLAPALHAGGRLAIVDVLPANDAPTMSMALYELSLAVRIPVGQLHPVEAYRRWLHLAGLLEVDVTPLGGRLPHTLVTGARSL